MSPSCTPCQFSQPSSLSSPCLSHHQRKPNNKSDENTNIKPYLTFPPQQNLSAARMMKYSTRAMTTKVMLRVIHMMSGQTWSDLGMVLAVLLVRLIIMRRRVMRRPHLAATSLILTAKLAQLTATMREQGMKWVYKKTVDFLSSSRLNP